MKLAMYKGPAKGLLPNLAHLAICLRSFSKYSHCEIVFTEPNINGYAVCASSSWRDGGVRFKSIKLDSGHWDLIDLPGYDVEYAKAWFDNHIGKKYDVKGLLFFILPIRLESRNKYFCSEACAAALKLKKAFKLYPAKLGKLV